MRRWLSLLVFALALVAARPAYAGVPSIPNPNTAVDPFGITLVTQPNPYTWIDQPGISSQPIVNLPICPGDIVTTFILNYCGGLMGAPAPGNGQLYPTVATVFTGAGGFGGACVSLSGGACVTLCADGSFSSSTGSGTCSSHGGELCSPTRHSEGLC